MAGAAPYAAEEIKAFSGDNDTLRLTAHAVAGAVLAKVQGHSALAGGAGALSAEAVAKVITESLYPGIANSELTEQQKETISAASTLVGGLAGGLTGKGLGGGVAGAQTGKNAVENNFLSTPAATQRDKLAEKIQQGDKTLQTSKGYLELENADRRSDALVASFKKDPSAMTEAERIELNSYIRYYAAEMQTLHGNAVTKELVTGLLTGPDYLKSAPNNEAQKKAQTIMNTWGYHTSNASMGDPALLYGLGPLGQLVKTGMITNAAIGVGVNTSVQLSGNDPFSYVDAVMAGVTAAATTRKGILPSVGINVGGAALSSAAKGEDPTNAMLSAGAGTLIGSIGGSAIKVTASTVAKETLSDLTGNVGANYISEKTGNLLKDALDERGNKNAEK